MDDILTFNPTGKKALSRLCCIFSKLMPLSLSSIQRSWELELQITMDEDTWDNVIERIHRSSVCARHSLIQFKIVHRTHISKTNLAKIFPHPTCDRCKIADATLAHMFWFCPALERFWRSIFDALSTTFGVRIAPNPLIAIFGISPDHVGIQSGGNRIISFTTLLARRLILLGWKEATPPTFTHWLRDVLLNLRLEKIRCTLHGSRDKFLKIWRPFLEFFDQPTTTLEI